MSNALVTRDLPARTLMVFLIATILFGCSARDFSSLHEAVRVGDDEAAASLLRGGADPNEGDGTGMAPLMSAANRDDPDMIGVLLAAGADPDAPGLGGLTPIHVAARANAPHSLTALIDAGVDPSTRSASGMNAMDNAAAADSPNAIRFWPRSASTQMLNRSRYLKATAIPETSIPGHCRSRCGTGPRELSRRCSTSAPTPT